MLARLLIRVMALGGLCFCFSGPVQAQRYLSDYDSLLFMRDTLRPFLKRMENLRFSGYMQPQFQAARRPGAPSFEGGNFSEFSNNRFMLRRARIKIDYLVPEQDSHLPNALFTFQIDATERGVIVRDMFVRLYDPKGHNFSITGGLFAHPFGYEVNLSSAYRETPERARMSQILMPSERDLGAMLSFEQIGKSHNLPIKWDAGVFNGEGPAGPTDFDSYKDIVSRLTLKPLPLSKSLLLSGGLSFLNGGWRQATRYRYEVASDGASKFFALDSSEANIGGKAPRRYYGADVQLANKYEWGKTEVRAEYWRGKQPGSNTTTTSPAIMPTGPTYVRPFDGAVVYLLQNIVNQKWELMAKFDWYDPNTRVSGMEIGKVGTNLTPADIKFTTLGVGLTNYINDYVKVLAYYDWVQNEKTALAGFTTDLKDNIFTLRMQLRF